MIYLDNAATTYPKPECVYIAMDKTNRELAFNAGRGSYNAAHEASEIIDRAKAKLTDLFNAAGYADIVFTPSVTHAINQILHGIDLAPGATIYISPYEHNAVARTAFALSQSKDINIEILPVQDDLSLDIGKTEYLFASNPPAVVVLNALSNVTGYIAPVEEIFTMAKDAGAITILDAAQAAGLVDLDMPKLNADIICFAGHKTLMGPFGIGGFALRKSIALAPVFTGGTGSDSLNLNMPTVGAGRYEASSPNIVAIAGLLAALENLNPASHREHLEDLGAYFSAQIEGLDNVHILGITNTGNLGIFSFVVDGYLSDEVGTILNEEFDIAVRTGYHCAPHIHDHLNDKPFNGTIRVGFGPYNTKNDIDALINALESL